MRILQVIPKLDSYSNFLEPLCSFLVENDIEVHCACSLDELWGSGKSKRSSARIHHIPFPRSNNFLEHLRTSFLLNNLTKSIRPDIVHAHFSSTIFTTALAMRQDWPTTIGTFQGIYFLSSRGGASKLIKIAETWASRRLHQVWVVTEDDLLGLRLAAPHANIKKQESYGFGCDLKRFNSQRFSSEERQMLRLQLGLKVNNYVFTFVGRYVHFKGFDVTVRAFLKLARSEPDIRLLLIGIRDNFHPTGLTKSEEEILKDSTKII